MRPWSKLLPPTNLSITSSLASPSHPSLSLKLPKFVIYYIRYYRITIFTSLSFLFLFSRLMKGHSFFAHVRGGYVAVQLCGPLFGVNIGSKVLYPKLSFGIVGL